jgi:hypothetical protein
MVLEDYNFLGMDLQLLLQWLRHEWGQWWFILSARLSGDIDQAVRLIFSGILVLVFLPMLIEYFNGYVCARSFGIAYQIKTIGESSLVFLGLWLGIYF